jgi:serine/threonine-protein kinase ATR
LVPAFKTSQDPSFQDPVAYAIQELLRFCGFSADSARIGTSDSLGAKWREFAPEVGLMMEPLLVSRYKYSHSQRKSVAFPIFRTKSSFREWSKTLTMDLIGRIPAGGNAEKIFSACESMVKNEVFGIPSLLLPHLVLCVVCLGSAADKDALIMEITALLEEAAIMPNPDEALRRMCQVLTCNHWTWLNRSHSVRSSCIPQTVFGLLDHLNAWVRTKMAARDKSRQPRSVDPPDSKLNDVQSFLGQVKHSTLAKAAYNCHAYSRALRHGELHLRDETRRGVTENALFPWWSLQLKIFTNLDEPDSIEGVSGKMPTRTLEQEVLIHESAGRWTAAQSCYEMLLQEHPDKLEYELGLLKCQRNLGHFGEF